MRGVGSALGQRIERGLLKGAQLSFDLLGQGLPLRAGTADLLACPSPGISRNVGDALVHPGLQPIADRFLHRAGLHLLEIHEINLGIRLGLRSRKPSPTLKDAEREDMHQQGGDGRLPHGALSARDSLAGL